MKSFSFSPYALGICLAGAMLAACSGAQPVTVSPSGAMPRGASAPPPRTLEAIYNFAGHPDGEEPDSPIVAPTRAPAYPKLIGTTEYGGYYNLGAVYGLTKGQSGWNESVLYQLNGSDGWRPNAVAIPKKLDGTNPVFVTSFAGGSSNNGAVAVLRPNSHGMWTLLSSYSFAGKPDGAAPHGPMIEDANGNLYGTTSSGGAQGDGAIYRLQPNGSSYTESIVYSFRGAPDGSYPVAGQIADNTGAFYGTTEFGGTGGLGTVFKLTPSGSGYTESILYSFRGSPDGAQPLDSLYIGPDGALYGTTSEGGNMKNNGTVFKLARTDRSFMDRVLWTFGSVAGDGAFPWGSVLVDQSGVIYGTTIDGGQSGSGGIGTFFTLTPSGKGAYNEKRLYFNGYNGAGPEAGPTADDGGNLYVPASGDGAHLDGVVDEVPKTAAQFSFRKDSVPYVYRIR
jgi:uncharacterized repeat protein (TIGR03803 family)